MPMIYEPELELNMSNFKRYISHSEGSNRHLHEPVKAVLHSVQGQRLADVATSTPMSDELLEHLERFPPRGGNSVTLKWMESTIIQTSNQKSKELT
ncbi:hypothetical protein O181_021022 [Austropuccinia psidii MF-1]|uniref:Uncharacterized protein n=1 Tax=Austropuccinia psidii MF-1 TaxID=1389203 RepID=A0A9Q3CEN8_9BASI|nr:hypothetical protein [Austropuccinia psidii MF-1]